MSRYSDILRGPQLQDAFTKYQAWLQLSPSARRTKYNAIKNPQGRAKHRRVTGYISPFSTADAGLFLKTKILSETQPAGNPPADGEAITDNDCAIAARTIVDTLVATTEPSGASVRVLKVPKFQFAKIVVRDRLSPDTRDTSPQISRITDRPYKRYRSFTASCPFGKDATRTTYSLAVSHMSGLAAYTSWIQNEGDAIGFYPERSSLA